MRMRRSEFRRKFVTVTDFLHRPPFPDPETAPCVSSGLQCGSAIPVIWPFTIPKQPLRLQFGMPGESMFFILRGKTSDTAP